MEDIKQQLKSMIMRSLRIPEQDAEELEDDHPLIDGPLEIDSIDLLQLVVDIEKSFGIKLVDGKFDRDVWTNLNTLAAAIHAKVAESKRS